MAEVDLKIAGRAYTVACDDGQEAHLLAVAATVDAEARGLQAQMAQLPEARLLLMTALMLADKGAPAPAPVVDDGAAAQLRDAEAALLEMRDRLGEAQTAKDEAEAAYAAARTRISELETALTAATAPQQDLFAQPKIAPAAPALEEVTARAAKAEADRDAALKDLAAATFKIAAAEQRAIEAEARAKTAIEELEISMSADPTDVSEAGSAEELEALRKEADDARRAAEDAVSSLFAAAVRVRELTASVNGGGAEA